MEKFKELWVSQRDYLIKMKQSAEDIRNVTEYKIPQIYWVFNDTEERIDEQLDILAKLPWEYTGLYRILKKDIIFTD